MDEEDKKYDEHEEEMSIQDKVLDKIEENIDGILEQPLTNDNLDRLFQLVDVHKDICNEKYWKTKESEIMRYSNYGNYNTYDGNYNNYGRDEYGRRGRDSMGRYRGDDHMDRMYENYNRYEEGRNEYNRGNYGAKNETLMSLKYMLESMEDFVKMLKSEAGSQEEMQLIREYTQKISQM